MQLHERYFHVRGAEIALDVLILDWLQKHDLTYLEALRAFNNVSQTWLNRALAAERHGENTDKKADEE